MKYLRNQKFIIWSIITIALIIRVSFVLINGHNMFLGDFNKFNNDDVKYIRSGMILLEEHKLVYKNPEQATAFIGPILPIMLAMVFSIFGSDMSGILAFQLLQAIIGTVSVGLIYVLGRNIFNNKIGIIAAAIYALEPCAVRNTGYILTETIFTFLILLITILSLKALENKSVMNYVILGIIWAITSMLKSAIGMFFGVIFIAMILYKYKLKEIIKYSLITCSVFVIVMSPWWVRNYSLFNKFIPFTASSGNPMILGSFINNKVIKGDVSGYEYAHNEIEQNEIEMKVAKERITRKFKEDFAQYAYWFTIGKTIYFWKDPFYWKSKVVNSADFVIFPMVFIIHYTLLILGVIGIVLCLMKDFKKAILPIGVMAYMNLVHLPFFVMSRYSFPLMPLMIIMGVYGVVKFAEIVRPQCFEPSQGEDSIDDKVKSDLKEQVVGKVVTD